MKNSATDLQDGEDISLDVSALGRADLRDSVRRAVKELGYTPKEKDFLEHAFTERTFATTLPSTVVVGDLARLADRYTRELPQRWVSVVRRTRPYFVAFVRTRRDERCAALVDNLLRHSDFRMTVCRGTSSRAEIRKCLARAVSALEPESLVEVRVSSAADRLRVEFADGLAGAVEWDRLGMDQEMRRDLVLESATVGERGKTVEFLTEERELFEVDGAAIRAVLDPEYAAALEEVARRSDASVGERVREVREVVGLTQAALGERIGADQAVISRLERGRHRPRFDTLSRVAEGLGLTVAELLQN